MFAPLVFVIRSWYKTRTVIASTQNGKNETRLATFRLAETDYREVEEIAATDDRSVSAVLRLAVRAYLEERKAA